MKTPLTLLTLIFLSIGCSSDSVNKPIEGRADPYLAPQISFADPDLRKMTAVGTPIVQRDSISNHLVVTVPIRSAVNKTIYVDYSATFLDRNGIPVGNYGPMTKTFDPNVPDQIMIQSTTPEAADFQLTLRFAR